VTRACAAAVTCIAIDVLADDRDGTEGLVRSEPVSALGVWPLCGHPDCTAVILSAVYALKTHGMVFVLRAF
jgi:hypothetical protein